LFGDGRLKTGAVAAGGAGNNMRNIPQTRQGPHQIPIPEVALVAAEPTREEFSTSSVQCPKWGHALLPPTLAAT
jgi:hypothetical protein